MLICVMDGLVLGFEPKNGKKIYLRKCCCYCCRRCFSVVLFKVLRNGKLKTVTFNVDKTQPQFMI